MSETRHPDEELLHRVALDAADPRLEADVLSHVAACASCAEQVARLRRMEVSLALQSEPPRELLDRIRERRSRGDQVSLTVPLAGANHLSDEELLGIAEYSPEASNEDLGHARECQQCQAAIERMRAVSTMLATLSRPPASLQRSTAARRAAGERVLLEIPSAPVARGVESTTTGRRFLSQRGRWALAAAAVALFAFVWRLTLRESPSDRNRLAQGKPPADSITTATLIAPADSAVGRGVPSPMDQLGDPNLALAFSPRGLDSLGVVFVDTAGGLIVGNRLVARVAAGLTLSADTTRASIERGNADSVVVVPRASGPLSLRVDGRTVTLMIRDRS
jgi:cytochrome c553